MKRSFAVGVAAFAIMLAVALSFGANSAEAQLLCRVKARCTPVVKSCCARPKLQLRTRCCKPAPKCCETPAPTCCAKPAPSCCQASTSCCAPKNPCCPVSRLVSKLKSRGCCGTSTCSTGCDSCSTGCSDCEAKPAAADEKAIPPAPEKTEAKATTTP